MENDKRVFFEEFEKLEENYLNLHNFIKTMNFALQEIVNNSNDADCLVCLSEVINEKSSNFLDQLEDFSQHIYKNYY